MFASNLGIILYDYIVQVNKKEVKYTNLKKNCFLFQNINEILVKNVYNLLSQL